MAKKKNKLVIEPFDNIRIIGIVTGMMDYQLAWNINKVLKLDLVKYKSITSNGEDFFSFYYYDAGENSNAFNLVALSNGETRWVNFSPQTDYILIIRNYIKDSDFQSFLSNIKSITRIDYAYTINIELNRYIDGILEDIEFHEMDIMDEQNKNSRI